MSSLMQIWNIYRLYRERITQIEKKLDEVAAEQAEEYQVSIQFSLNWTGDLLSW